MGSTPHYQSPPLLALHLICPCREGKAQLQLAGAADPTGRGFGYSFVRDIRHKVGAGFEFARRTPPARRDSHTERTRGIGSAR